MNRPGFTLIDLMLIVAVIAIIAALVLPLLISDKTVELQKVDKNSYVKYKMEVYKVIRIDGDMFTLEDANGLKKFVHKTEKVDIIIK
ncbi:MAG: hypothetical protein V1701_02570 [Planctomycetota bacterium]